MTTYAKREVIVYRQRLRLTLHGLTAMLIETHQQMIRSTLKDKTVRSKITAEDRQAIRQICIDVQPVRDPQTLLIAFKSALAQAADMEGIPHDYERNALLSQLVSVFIDELFAVTDDVHRGELGLRNETPASAPRLILDNDSADTRL